MVSWKLMWVLLFLFGIAVGMLIIELMHQEGNDEKNSGKKSDGGTREPPALPESRLEQVTLPPKEAASGKDEETGEGPSIVINRKTNYKPTLRSEPFHFSSKTPNPQGDDRRYLILVDQAYKELKHTLEWGEKTRRNCVEQGGILLGSVESYHNEIYCFIKNILLAETHGDPAFVEFTSRMWADMQDRLDKINASMEDDEKLVIVGWFHTHPNHLAVFMSGTDMDTQRLNFSQKWQVSLVMNPHTNTYRVYFGADAKEGKVVFPEQLEEHPADQGAWYKGR